MYSTLAAKRHTVDLSPFDSDAAGPPFTSILPSAPSRTEGLKRNLVQQQNTEYPKRQILTGEFEPCYVDAFPSWDHHLELAKAVDGVQRVRQLAGHLAPAWHTASVPYGFSSEDIQRHRLFGSP